MPTSWRQQQRMRLRERLYEVALELFREQGYEKTGVAQITERVGVGKGTFFNHFASKEHLLAQWYNRLTRETLDQVRRARHRGAEPAVIALVRSLAARAAAEPDLSRMKARIGSDLLTGEEPGLDAELSGFIVEQIAAGKETGEIDPDLDPGFFATMVVAVLTGTGQGWVAARCGFDLEQAAGRNVAFLFRAARPAGK